MNIIELIAKIKSGYNKYLTDNDYQVLDNNPEENDIREIINRIWNRYLTNPFDYNGKGEFRYLVRKNDLLFFEPVDFENFPIFHDSRHSLELLTNENILEECGGRNGFVVKVDWSKTDKIFLPEDLIKEQHIKTKLIPTAIFCINIGEGKVNVDFDLANTIAEENSLLFLDLNIRNYDSDYKVGLGDKERIVWGMISWYLSGKPNFSHLEEHMRLRKLYGSYIMKRYNALTKEGLYQDTNFIQEISEYIDRLENVTRIKL